MPDIICRKFAHSYNLVAIQKMTNSEYEQSLDFLLQAFNHFLQQALHWMQQHKHTDSTLP